MNLTISRLQFFDALQKVTAIIGSRSTIPILGNVLLEADKEKLALTATDLDVRIRTEVPAKVAKPGSVTLPGKTALNVVRELPGEEVMLEVSDGSKIRLESGNSSYRLNGLAPDDFPAAPKVDALRSMSMPQAELGRMLALISYAASTDDSRKVLNGVLLSLAENTFTAVATDGKRLAMVEKVLEKRTGNDGSAIVPSKGAGELQRLLGKEGEVKVEISENLAAFTVGATHMVTKLVDGVYPNYRQVIPTSFSKKIELPTEVFAAALRRVSLVVSETSPFIRLTFAEDSLQLFAESQEKGECKENMPIKYSGQELPVSFNPLYLNAPFRALDVDRINLQLNDGFSPVAISGGDGFLYVIMPMRQK